MIPKEYRPKRNDYCPCNSGKKYKKCGCSKLKLYEKSPEVIISANHINHLKDDVLFRVSYKDLPEPFTEKIDKWLESNVVLEYCCWWNSHSLGLSEIDGIDMVNGYYGFKIPDFYEHLSGGFKSVDDFVEYLKNDIKFSSLSQPHKKNDWYRITPPEGSTYGSDWVDFKNEIFYNRHSWNKIPNSGTKGKGVGKDIHFDLTTEFWNNTKDVWTYLNEVETLPSGSIKNNSTLKKIYKERIDISTDMNIGKQKDLTYQYKLRQKKDE